MVVHEDKLNENDPEPDMTEIISVIPTHPSSNLKTLIVRFRGIEDDCTLSLRDDFKTS